MKSFICSFLLTLTVLYASSQPFSGTITNANSRPVPGASVYILNTGLGTFTNTDGHFEFKHLPAGKYTLRVSAIGYATVVEEITANSASSDVKIRLPAGTQILDAVLVSAQKKEELLQNVPFSISSLSAKQVNEYRLWDSKDLTAIIPNLYSTDPGDKRNVTSIRGITTTSYDPTVATYIDGVNQFSLDTYIAQLFDVERIEVLRGPQGTLYGRNAMGGVINIITRQPVNQTNGFASVSIGNHGQQRYEAGIRTPLIKDKLYVGVAGVYDGRNGFYTNDFNNTDFDKQHSATANVYLKYLVNDHWTAVLNVKHNSNRNNGTFPLVQGIEEAFANPFHLNQNAVTEIIDNTFNGSLSVNYAGHAFNFSSQTAFQKNHRHYTKPIDGDFSPIDGVTIINNYGSDWNNVNVWTQEFRFTSPAQSTSPLKWTGGTYLFAQDNPYKLATRFGEDADLVGAGPDKNFSIINTTNGKGFGVAVYGQVTYSITPKADITAGLRFDHEHKKLDVLSEYQHDPDPNPQFDLVPDTSGSANFNALSPKISFTYRATRDNNLYILYSRGYRAGGLTQLSSDPSQPPLYQYKPEYSNTVEVGSKNVLFGNHLQANLSAFYTTVADAQVPTLVLPDAITVTHNAGKLTSKGAELELAATPFTGFEAGYSLGYTHATYKTLKLSQNGGEVNLAGNHQVFTPEITSMLALQYSYALDKRQLLKLVLRGEWMYLGKQYFDLANQISQNAYSLLNTRFGITTPHVDVLFWMRNIGNEKYIAYAYDFGAVHLGNPRTFGVTVTGKL
jgi:iron complex outermembrane recepter protein